MDAMSLTRGKTAWYNELYWDIEIALAPKFETAIPADARVASTVAYCCHRPTCITIELKASVLHIHTGLQELSCNGKENILGLH